MTASHALSQLSYGPTSIRFSNWANTSNALVAQSTKQKSWDRKNSAKTFPEREKEMTDSRCQWLAHLNPIVICALDIGMRRGKILKSLCALPDTLVDSVAPLYFTSQVPSL